MKFRMIIIFSIFFCNIAVFAGGGWASSAIDIKVNSGSNYLYKLNDEGWTDGTWGANNLFNTYNFGSPTALVLDGAAGNGWTDDSPGYTTSSFVLYYRVYLSTNSGGAWNSIALDNLSYHSGANYIYDKSSANINILALTGGFTGTFILEVVMSKNQFYTGGNWNSMVPGGQGTIYDPGTAGFKAIFTFAPLPVELVSYSASKLAGGIKLAWKTATETNNYGFEIERNTTGSFEKIGFTKGSGNSNAPLNYSFVDQNIFGLNKIIYRLKQVDNDGQFKYSPEINFELSKLETFVLAQNFPNPFNPSTMVSFSLPTESFVNLRVYNVLGEVVKEVINSVKSAGVHQIIIDAPNLSSGTYFYSVNATSADGKTTFKDTKKMLLNK